MEKIGLQAVWQNADFLKGQQEYINKINQAQSATQATAQSMSGSGGIGAAAVFVGSALGNLASTAIQSVIGGLTNMASTAINAVSSFQKLEMGLQSLAARELVVTGGADNIAQAFDMALPNAQAMLEALKEVSLQSPFEYQDIARTFQMSMAMGQGSKVALELTKAITDMTAVSPLASAELLERISYNFNQMSLTGKITARDIRDLAMAGVNFADVLRTQLSMSVEQANEALQSGAITMRDVTQAFIEYAETNFGGAAERMATHTIPGLVSSFKDLAFFASKDIFGPAAQVVVEFMNKVYTKAKELLDSGVLMKIGAWLKVLAEMATKFLAKVFGIDLTETIDATTKTATQALQEGVANTAKVVADTAAQAVQQAKPAFQGIGLETANAWLQGFTSADFSLLNTISSPLSSLSRIMAQQLGLSSEQASAGYANLMADITKAISGGNLEGAFARIVAQFGSAGQTIVNLAKANMAVADSTKAVQDAEKKLADARKAREASESKANRLVHEYNQLLREGTDANSDMMRQREREIQAAYAEQDAAAQAIETAEADLEAKKEAEKAAKEQADTQRDLVNALLQFAQTQSSAMEESRKALEDTGNEVENLSTLTSEDIFQGINEGANKFAEVENEVRTKLETLIATLRDKFGPAWTTAQNIAGKVYEWFKTETSNLVTELESWWQRHGGSLITIWEFIKTKASEVWSEIAPSITNIISENWENTKQIFSNILEQVGLVFDTIAQIIQGKWGDAWNSLSQIAMLAFENIGLLIDNQVNFWLEILYGILGEELRKKIENFWTEQFPLLLKRFGDFAEDIKNNLKNKFSEAFEAVKNTINNAKEFFVNMFDDMQDAVSRLWNYIFDFVNNALAFLYSGFEWLRTTSILDFFRDIGWWIDYLWDKIVSFINEPLSWLSSTLSSLFGLSSSSGTPSSSTSTTSSYTAPSVSTVAPTTAPVSVVVNVGSVNNGMDTNTLTGLITNTINGLLAI